MKTFIAAAVALSLLGGTAASAQPYGHDDRDHHNGAPAAQQGYGHDDRDHQMGNGYGHDDRDHHMGNGYGHDDRGGHHWNRGDRLPASYRTHDRYVDYRAHHLRAPPRGYRWVRTDDNNYAMVAITTGLIASIIAATN